jgi:hypothetical protein
MATKLHLFDLFSESGLAGALARWPQTVQPITGFIASWPPPTFSAWLAALNNAVVVQDVRTGADGDRAAVEARLAMTQVSDYPSGFPFVISSMPDVEFRLQYSTSQQNLIQLFASISDRGAEVVLERLPVEIRLPSGLITTPTIENTGQPIDDYAVGDFEPGQLDDLKIIYRSDQPTSIFVHTRIHVTEDGEFDIRMAVPVSFGECTFSGIPCLALHDFQLIPSPNLAPNNVHWLRHSVRPWAPALVGPVDGCFSIRSVQVDPDREPLKKLANWLHDRSTPTAEQNATNPSTANTPPAPGSKSDTHAEFVLDDLVIPFFSPWVIPIPRHITIGIRRRIIDADDPEQVYRFADAPIQIKFQEDPPAGLIINSFFYTSEPGGVGLTFDIVFYDSRSDRDAKDHPSGIGISLEEDYTFALSYRRDIDPTTKLPVLATAQPYATLDKALHFEIATVTIDVILLKLGYSFGRSIVQQASPADSFEALVDIFVGMPPSGVKGAIELKSLNGEQVKFIMEGVGWRFGGLHLEGVQLPDGVVILIAGRFGLVIQELGLRSEQGATYLSFSGGILKNIPSGWKGGASVRRLRFRIAGNPGAPGFKMDGFFSFFEMQTFYLEVGGYFTEEKTQTLSRREFGLTGTIRFESGGKKYKISLDLIIGHVTIFASGEDYIYMMVQIVLEITISIQYVDLLRFRGLFARNMKPKLRPVDRDARDLRYYRWYRENDPLTVPGNRRLEGWESSNDAWAIGAGFGISFTGMGSVFDLNAFTLFLWGPDEKGLLIVVELHLLGKPKPLGYLAIELDFQNGRFSGILGLAVSPSIFMDNPPDWLDNIGEISGTIYISNDPKTFAIGRLNDQRTWLGSRFDFKNVFHFDFLLCLELVENGPHGFGLVVRIEGTIEGGIFRVILSMGLGIMVQVFTTASHDFALVAWLEAAFRIVVLGFLNFGVSANATGRNVGSRPSRGELSFEIHLETPWFIPDVTWTWEITFGTLAPSDLATSTSPLSDAGAVEGPQERTRPIHGEYFDANHTNRFDPQYTNTYRPMLPTFSVNDLRAQPRPEATRLANFAADSAVSALATDATITVDWSVPVNDKLALTPGVTSGQGSQHSGDLTLTYDLVGVQVRRRARFGSDQAWHGVDQRLALPADFSDTNGVKLGGSFSPQIIQAHWDLGVRADGGPAPKRLLINSITPFQFATSDPVTDEELVRQNPQWPCCPPDSSQPFHGIHSLTFASETPGIDIDTPRFFSESTSRFTFLRPVIALEHQLGGLPTGVIVAGMLSRTGGVLARAMFTEDVAYCMFRLAWSASIGALAIIARDASGTVVGNRTIPLMPGRDFQTIIIGGSGPIRCVELCQVVTTTGDGRLASTNLQLPQIYMEVAGALYIALNDYLDLATTVQCDNSSAEFHAAYEGKGKLFFLPNHEYEIALTTRVSITHPSTPVTSADVTEYLYFRTKGLPGLNAAQRIGEEIEPYVRSSYSGGRGVLYREEPVTLAFAEDFSIAVPLLRRATAATPEQAALLRMQLVVRPDTAPTAGTPFTATSPDWIVENRAAGATINPNPTWNRMNSIGTTLDSGMISANAYRNRLAQITQRPNATCGLADPRKVIGTVLVAPPQSEPNPVDPAKQLWPAALAHTATVLVEGAPFVERIVFEPADLTAFQFSVDNGGGDANAWSVSSGDLITAAGTTRRYAIFGDPSWNHFRVSVRIQFTGPSDITAGVTFALPAGITPVEGLFAYIEVNAAGRRLVLARRTITGGTALVEEAGHNLPEPVDPVEPQTLQVWSFDDKVRASVGDVVVEADCGALREGRVALVAQGPVHFNDLRLQGLELYNFPFTTSHYASFHDHIQSWIGELAQVSVNALGAGTTTSTVSALWAATQADISTAMQPDAPASGRDAIFARWIRELGLPLQDDVTRLELSRFVVAGQTTCLLVESLEPIDFTAEVTATLERCVKSSTTSTSVFRTGKINNIFDIFESQDNVANLRPASPYVSFQAPLAASQELNPTLGSELSSLEADFTSELFRRLGGSTAESQGASVSNGPENQANPIVMGWAHSARGIDVEFDKSLLPQNAEGSDVYLIERQITADKIPQARIYRGKLNTSGGRNRLTTRAAETDYIAVTGAISSTGLSMMLDRMDAGSIIAIITTPNGAIVSPSSTTTYENVPVRVIQDGSRRKAIIVPLGAGSAVTLQPGTYRLSLAIHRERWSTTDAPDAVNSYSDNAQVTLNL